MQFDIIDMSEEELKSLSVAQMKLLRAAQRNKDALVHNAEKQLEEFRLKVLASGMKNSTLLEDMRKTVYNEVDYKCAILADDLIYNLSLSKSGSNSGSGGGSYETGYLVDYSLSYNERYVIVRDYYLQFKNVEERMAKYSADEVAKKYLGTYYGTLYNVLATYEK